MTMFIMLLVVAFGSAFAVVWLLTYLPIAASFCGKMWSPRLVAVKMLAPFDAGITLILIAGSWVGLSTAATGIQMMVYNVLTGIGISIGVVATKNLLAPKWKKQFEHQILMNKGINALEVR